MNDYTDALEAGRHWPRPVPTEPNPEPYQFGSQTLARCPKCGLEYDAALVENDQAGVRRCPICTQLIHPNELPSPVTAADSLDRGRRAAANYNPTNL